MTVTYTAQVRDAGFMPFTAILGAIHVGISLTSNGLADPRQGQWQGYMVSQDIGLVH